MFGNFIYFMVVLLIYLTYQPSEETGLAGPQTFLLFSALTLVFAASVSLIFRRLSARIDTLTLSQADPLFHSALLRCSVLAVAIFAVAIYGLGLPSFVNDLPLLNRVPTLQALLFLLLFIGLLSLVWGFAFDAYQRLYQPEF